MNVTACIITKNEIHNIGTCIESCKRLAREIIVADTGSEDGTPEKAREMGAQVYAYQWNDDFAAAKNFALSKANGEWVFFPDADEYIEESTAKLLLTQMRKHLNAPNVDALTGILYNIDRQSGDVKKGSTVTRVFKRSARIYYRGKIHEKLVHEDRQLSHLILEKAKIYHTGYSADVLPQKHERNLRMLLQEEKENRADASNYYHIAGTLYALNRYGEALSYIKKLESHRDFRFLIDNFSLMPNFFIFKSLILMRLEEQGKAYSCEDMLSVIEEGGGYYPENCEIAEQKINILLYWSRYDEALKAYEKSIRLFEKAEVQTAFSHKRDKSRLFAGMARICAIKGDAEKAFDYYVEAVAQDYTFEMSLIGLLDLIKSRPAQEVIAFLSRIYDDETSEQSGFLAFASAKTVLPEVFFHYFSKLPAEDTDRYRRYLIYKNIFSENHGEAIDLTQELLENESNPEKVKELHVLQLASQVLGRESVQISLTEERERETYIGALEVLLRLNQIQEAEKFLDYIPEEDFSMMLKVADLMKNIGFFTAACDFYQIVLELVQEEHEQKETLSAWEGLAYCKYREGQFDEAGELYKKIECRSKSATQFLRWMER